MMVTHRIFNTDLLYSCSHFIVKNDEKKISLKNGFSYNLMTIFDFG